MSDHGFSTRSIHSGSCEGDEGKALNPPIHMTSSFSFDTIEHAEQVMDFASHDYVYTRGNNPTLRLFENRLAELERGAGAVAFASGMAAISSVLLSLTQTGSRILSHSTLYGSTHSVTSKLLPRYGIHTDSMDLRDIEKLESALKKQYDTGKAYSLVFFESPANPSLAVMDIRKIAELCREYGCKLVVDNTFASPYLQRPLELGADIVVHSATKYICGHGDALGGAAVAADPEYIHSLKFDYMCELGGVMSPFNAWLMLRGLKTLPLRMEKHSSNALEIAQRLEEDERFRRVNYPGLKNHPDHPTAAAQMRAFGGIISFELNFSTYKNGKDEVAAYAQSVQFVNNLKLIKRAVSLGDCETLIQFPAAMTHRSYDRNSLKNFGLTRTMLRLSAGLEDADDILNDILDAWNRLEM